MLTFLMYKLFKINLQYDLQNNFHFDYVKYTKRAKFHIGWNNMMLSKRRILGYLMSSSIRLFFCSLRLRKVVYNKEV